MEPSKLLLKFNESQNSIVSDGFHQREFATLQTVFAELQWVHTVSVPFTSN